VQVDPIKPTLKAPGYKRLQLKWNDLLSSFAFKFNLPRYTKDEIQRHLDTDCVKLPMDCEYKPLAGGLLNPRTCARPTLNRRSESARLLHQRSP